MADNEDQIYSLSDDQKRSYQTDGFLIVPNLVSMEYCDKLISDATDFAKDEIHNYLRGLT